MIACAARSRSENLLKFPAFVAEANTPDFVLYRSFTEPNGDYFLTHEIQSHIAAVQKQTRHDLYRLAQRVGRVARAFHECQELNDPFLFVRTFEVELIGETPAG